MWVVNMTKYHKFQSTLPMRGATASSGSAGNTHYVSIHAPYAGSDLMREMLAKLPCKFQSTLPMRGATPDFEQLGRLGGVSIHAPYAGSDQRG